MMARFNVRLVREERLLETAWIQVEAESAESAQERVDDHYRENGNEEDLDGETIDWEFGEQSTISTEVANVEAA